MAPRPSSWPPRGRLPRPFDVATLAHAIGIAPTDTAGLSLALGIGRRWIRRYRTVGLTERQADRWATNCGLNPSDVWPDIWHDWWNAPPPTGKMSA